MEKKKDSLLFNGNITKDKKGNPILGRLEGPCADLIHSTRNGRKYSEKLWEKVFNSDIVKEYFEAGGILGELDHPQDRTETDTSKVAICMPEPPIKKDGMLWGKWDILDTPNGRIAKTLADYGYKLGISSRGSGDVVEGYNGEESVDPETYDFQAFDLVLLPAVKKARLSVMESLSKKSLKQALTEEFNKSTEDEKIIMKETLNRLNMNEWVEEVEMERDGEEENKYILIENHPRGYGISQIEKDTITIDELKEILNGFDGDTKVVIGNDPRNGYYYTYSSINENGIKEVSIVSSPEELEENNKSEKIEYIKGTKLAAENDGADMAEQFQELLKQQEEAEKKILNLQEKLSVCYAKETKFEENINRYKELTINLSKMARKASSLQSENNSLTEQLKAQSNTIKRQSDSIDKMAKELSEHQFKSNSLNESLNKGKEEALKLRTELVEAKKVANSRESSLKEEIENIKQDLAIKTKDYSQKLNKAKALNERYAKIANIAVDRYIDSKASMIGVDKSIIKNKLTEKYTFEDVDRICEDIKSYKLNLGKLPFQITEESRVKIVESQEPIKKTLPQPISIYDDDIDDSLLRLSEKNQ